MDLFHKIDDGVAIVRLAKGVHKQVPLYRRADRVFIGHGGGFVRVCAPFNGTFGTGNPNVSVLEMEGPGVDLTRGEPRFVAAPVKAAA